MPRQLKLGFQDNNNDAVRDNHTETEVAPTANAVSHVLTRTREAGSMICRDTETQNPLLDVADRPQHAGGERTKARDILAAIRILGRLDREGRPANPEEREMLARFGGFGPVALRLFPDPVNGTYKDHRWEELGEQLRSLLSDADYESAKRTTFNAFYTSPTVIRAMHQALDRLGMPEHATVLEPGSGIGRFISHPHHSRQFIGIELDRTSGRIAQALHPEHDIRIENFFATRHCRMAASTP